MRRAPATNPQQTATFQALIQPNLYKNRLNCDPAGLVDINYFQLTPVFLINGFNEQSQGYLFCSLRREFAWLIVRPQVAGGVGSTLTGF